MVDGESGGMRGTASVSQRWWAATPSVPTSRQRGPHLCWPGKDQTSTGTDGVFCTAGKFGDLGGYSQQEMELVINRVKLVEIVREVETVSYLSSRPSQENLKTLIHSLINHL